jgi:hypothetical protein
MGRSAWQVVHQKAKNSTSCGRPVAAKYLASLLRKPWVSTQVVTGAAVAAWLAAVAVEIAVGAARAAG